MEPQKLQSKAWSASDLVSAASTVVDMAAPALSTVLAQEHEVLEQEQNRHFVGLRIPSSTVVRSMRALRGLFLGTLVE